MKRLIISAIIVISWIKQISKGAINAKRSKAMKPTGYVRKLDRMGRVDLPISLRRTFNIEVYTPIEYFVEGLTIVLKKYEPSCVFCKGT